jgi:hypothetical protein
MVLLWLVVRVHCCLYAVGGYAGGVRTSPRQNTCLKALYEGFHYRELARILFIKFRQPIDHTTVKAIWQASPVSQQERPERWATTPMPTVPRPG